MSGVISGSPDNFIDTQGIELRILKDPTPASDIIYTQVLSVQPANLDHSMAFHQLTNDTVDKIFGLTNAAFEVVMMATQPELAGLLALTTPVVAQLPIETWQINLTDQSGNKTSLDGDAVLKNLRIVDAGVGSVTLEFSLEFVSGQSVTPATAGVQIV